MAHPVHLTLRGLAGLPPFRERAIFVEMCAAIVGVNRSRRVGSGFRVVEFSVQNDHVHLIIEAHDKETLIRGARGLAIRTAFAVHCALASRGPVWGDRYDARALRTQRLRARARQRQRQRTRARPHSYAGSLAFASASALALALVSEA